MFAEYKNRCIFALAIKQRSVSSVGYPEYSGLPVTDKNVLNVLCIYFEE